jgi:hypothetical protein
VELVSYLEKFNELTLEIRAETRVGLHVKGFVRLQAKLECADIFQ